MSLPTPSRSLLTRKPDAVLGLATGSSPLPIYDELAARCTAGRISFARARGFTLDEYVGLPPDHPERYRNVIDTVFVSRVDFAPGRGRGPRRAGHRHPGRVRVLRGGDPRRRRHRPADPRASGPTGTSVSTSRGRRWPRGPGSRRSHGRPGWTMPGSSAATSRRCPPTASLRDSGTIMAARHVVLVATGRNKAEAVHQLVEGPVSALWPATVPAAPPACHGPDRRRRRPTAAVGRLLPGDLPVQTRLAGHLRCC